MAESQAIDLGILFQAVGDVLRQNRSLLNEADQANGNHGDHMVEIFEVAAKAAGEKREAGLSEAMEYAAQLLQKRSDNGSAQVYAHGLRQFSEQFSHYNVSLDDLVTYVRASLAEGNGGNSQAQPAVEDSGQSKSGDVLKALISGLAGWGRVERGQEPASSALDMGSLFEFGMAYLQAKQRGGSRLEILADTAASVSPLASVPHRYQSGKLAILSVLQAMRSNGL